MRNEIFSCHEAYDRCFSFKFFKNCLHFLMSIGSFVVSDSLVDLLADVFHLGVVFSVQFSSFDEGYELLVFAVDRFIFARCSCSCVLLKYFCLTCLPLPLLSSRVAAQVFPFHRLLQPPSFVVRCPSTSASSFAADAVVVVVCCCSSISDSSCAGTSCLPVILFSSSSYLRSISWSFF